jgi:hypothetical protein
MPRSVSLYSLLRGCAILSLAPCRSGGGETQQRKPDAPPIPDVPQARSRVTGLRALVQAHRDDNNNGVPTTARSATATATALASASASAIPAPSAAPRTNRLGFRPGGGMQAAASSTAGAAETTAAPSGPRGPEADVARNRAPVVAAAAAAAAVRSAFADVPEEVLRQIFSLLHPRWLARCSIVCREWQYASPLPPNSQLLCRVNPARAVLADGSNSRVSYDPILK